ncbi:MAG: NADPH-dependent glutamate synthase [Chloroflexota bacterium]|nr:NADPH-dependent glutamate synthase [Chloroflexota bacterium]
MSTDTLNREIDRRDRVHTLAVDYDMRPVEERIMDFAEALVGFDAESAQLESSRCMQCPAPQPCVTRCPAGNDVPQALWLASEGDFIGAAKVFAATSPLPEVCGRVCPNLCQYGCVMGRWHGSLSIGKLEAFVTDRARQAGELAIEVPETKTGKRVAVVGSGPAGITVAEDLVKLGHNVTVYEAWPVPGGVLVYGIPSFKLDKHVVMYKIKDLEDAGVHFITNFRIGDAVTVDDLAQEYDAVFLGTGAGVEATMDIPGDNLDGIYSATEFLVRANVPRQYLPLGQKEKPAVGKRVAIIGGGDTAVDCGRSSIRLGAEEVTIVYRRTEAEMPGNAKERAISVEEGLQIDYLRAPVEFIGDENGHVEAMKIIKMELGEPDSSGRRRPVPIEGSEFIQDVDTAILAIGYWPDPLMGETTRDLATHKWGLIVIDDETGATSREGVFAGGDNVHGPDLVVTAIAAGHTAADNIHAFLCGENIQPSVVN